MRRATQNDVARAAGVSRQLVSLVINQDPRVAPETRARVLATIESLGYRANKTARSLAMARSGIVGILIPDFVNPFYTQVAQEVRDHCEEAGLTAFVTTTGHVPETVPIQRFADFQADGLVLVAPMLTNDELAPIARHTPTVLLTRTTGPEEADLIHTDDALGTRLATRALLAGGYDSVAFIGLRRDLAEDTAITRQHAFMDEVRAAGLEATCHLIQPGEVGGLAEELLRTHRPGLGIVAHNDILAFSTASVALAHQWTLGKDIGITGYDNTYLAQFPGSSLTSVDQDAPRMAEAAVRFILERLDGRTERRELVTTPELVERRSTTR